MTTRRRGGFGWHCLYFPRKFFFFKFIHPRIHRSAPLILPVHVAFICMTRICNRPSRSRTTSSMLLNRCRSGSLWILHLIVNSLTEVIMTECQEIAQGMLQTFLQGPPGKRTLNDVREFVKVQMPDESFTVVDNVTYSLFNSIPVCERGTD